MADMELTKHNFCESDEFFLFGHHPDKILENVVQPYYLKSEADKFIAELKADYQEACDRLQTANIIKDEQLAETRHQKWKRCLNKAEWCEERCARYDSLQEHSGFSWRREIDFYFRWYQRWLALAEKFKEA